MDIIDKLKAYNKNKGDIELISSAIEEMELRLQLQDNIQAQVLSDMPGAGGKNTKSATESLLIEKERMREQLLELRLQKVQQNQDVIIIENKLKLLDNHERYIVTKKYIENIKYSWEIRKMFEKDVGVYLSEKSYVRKLSNARRKMKNN